MEKVSIVKAKSYENAYLSVKKSIDLIGGLDVSAKKVLLKINGLSAKQPEAAVTTHPEIVRAVIRLVKENGGVPVVGDSPGLQSFESVIQKNGVMQVCKDENASWLELDDPVEMKNPHGMIIKSFWISKKLQEFDMLINLPKLKTHSLCGMTLAVKNLFG